MLDLRNGDAKVCPQCEKIKPISHFKDKSLITGLSRFCSDCKTQNNSRKHIPVKNSQQLKTHNQPSKSDISRLLSFSEAPEKYATGTSKAMEKVEYLESIKHKFSEGQLATYTTARNKYDAAIITKRISNAHKSDYSDILAEAMHNQRSVNIRYKNSWRKIDPYSLNRTYVVAYCHTAHDMRTFRVDRIQGAKLLDGFKFDRSLHTSAQSKLTAAHNYRW